MSAEQAPPTGARGRIGSWILRIFVWSIVLLFFVGATGSVLLIEAPFHFALGWMLHANRILPQLLGQWHSLLVPVSCLIVAGVMTHRFVRWWIQARRLSTPWSPAQTIIALAILLLACGAAIAMSGITHQFAWLMSEPWIENRGRRFEQTTAINNARQLLMALDEYHDDHGCYPNSFQQLQLDGDDLERLLWFKPGSGKAPEPFVLLMPGQQRPAEGRELLIVSPVIGATGKVAVGYTDTSASTLYERQFVKVLDEKTSEPSDQQ